MTMNPQNLDELLEAVRAGRYSDDAMTDLPTFGGEEPHDTSRSPDGLGGAIWSWDAKRLLVGTCGEDLRIIRREG